MNTELTSGTSIRARSTSCSPASPRSSRSAGALASATVTQRQDAMMVPHSNPEKCRSRPIELLRALTKEGYGLHLFEPRWFEKDAPQQSFKSPTVVPTPDKSQIVHGLKDACAGRRALARPGCRASIVKETGELSFLGEICDLRRRRRERHGELPARLGAGQLCAACQPTCAARVDARRRGRHDHRAQPDE
ncbi:MAG: GH36-type glycosyl hydrolase domain-containing protein [Acutalibacteraceae bacterium]